MNGDPRSLPELISQLIGDLANLVRKESELVRAEVGEKLGLVAKAGVGLGVGAALLLGAFLVILAAIVLALSKVMDPVYAALLVGVLAGIAGFVMLKGALRQIQPDAMKPERTARQVQKDIRLMKGQTQ